MCPHFKLIEMTFQKFISGSREFFQFSYMYVFLFCITVIVIITNFQFTFTHVPNQNGSVTIM